MARPLRIEYEHALYHVMSRGHRKENIFFADRDREVFVKKLHESLTKYSVILYCFCLMGNHYHLLIVLQLLLYHLEELHQLLD